MRSPLSCPTWRTRPLRRRAHPPHRRAPLARAAATAWLLAALPPALAQTAPLLPQGAQVQAGQATITTQGALMTVRNAPNTVLNWQSFNIGAGAGVYFEQANAASRVLNRVTGNDPSAIFGTLASNGQVWLLNPHGVLFGSGARVDVAGLMAGTLRLADSDFLAGRYRFGVAPGDAPALVRNEGTLRTVYGGQIALVGTRVENAGEASAPGGQVTLAAGRSVELVDTGLPNLVVRLREGAGEAINTGRLVADGGRIDLHGAIVNQEGVVRADTLAPDAEGRIVLRASDTLTLGERSVTAATAAPMSASPARGEAPVPARGEAPVPARGDAPPSPRASARGGSIDLLGSQVALVGEALVDVSGAAGGGTIRLGGGLQGRDASVPNARAVFIGPAAELRADASGARGAGGRIVVWSDDATRAYGRFSATGGRLAGDGGFVETSGGWLDARPAAMDLSARAGRAGTWLLDPHDILITSAATAIDEDIAPGPGPVFTSVGASSILTTRTLAAALNGGASVRVVTGNDDNSFQFGHIEMRDATLAVAPPIGVTLSLEAHRDIVISDSVITSTGAPLSLSLSAAGSGFGAIEISGSRIATNGGNITLGGTLARQFTRPDGTLTPERRVATAWAFDGDVEGPQPAAANGNTYGIEIRSSTFDLGAGTFAAAGYSDTGAGIHIGASPFSETAVRIDARNIELFGVGEVVGTEETTGVLLRGLTTLAATQSMSIEGSGRTGVQIEAGARLALNGAAGSGASLAIAGYGSAGHGVWLVADVPTGEGNEAGPGSRVTVDNGSLAVQARSAAEAGLVMTNDAGAPGPLIDLTGATGATFDVPASAAGTFGSTSILLDNVTLALPAAGSTSFSGNLGITWNGAAAGGGSGSLSLSGPGVHLFNSTITGAGLAVNFAATGAQREGVSLEGSTITTGGGDVRFGAEQIATSPRLGTTAAAMPWIEIDGGGSDNAALSVYLSTIDAGSGSIRGGGANRAAGDGVEILSSTLSAREIHLAGRSEAWTGLRLRVATLDATAQLTLDGASAGSSAAGSAGLRVLEGSTLRLQAAAGGGGAQMRLHGENLFGGRGLVVQGGTQARGSLPTQLVVNGASLLVEGLAAGQVGLELLGNLAGQGPEPQPLEPQARLQGVAASPLGLGIDALGATAVTLRGSSNAGASANTSAALVMQTAELLGPSAAGASVTLDATGALTLADSQLSNAGAMTLRARGAGVNGSLLSLMNSSLTAGGALIVDGQASSGGIGVSLLGGDTIRGANVQVNGAGSGASGVLFSAPAVASTLGATAGNLTIDGGATSGALPSVTFAGGWALQASDTLTLRTRNGLPLVAGSQPGLQPAFNAGRFFVLAGDSPAALAIGQGGVIDSGALTAALAGMPATATTVLLAPAAGGSITISGAIDVPSRLTLQAERIDITGGGSLASRAGGDAIVLGGASSARLAGFGNSSTAGAAALAAPNGRWLLLADDPRQVTLGGLVADFTVFGLQSGGDSIIPATGNVFGFGVPVVTLTGSAGDPATASSNHTLEAARAAVTVHTAWSTPTKSRLFDAAVALEGGEGMSERTLDWSSLPREEAISLLAARARYKQKVFANGVYRLQQDPRLGDAPVCANETEAQTGRCIVTEALKRQLLAVRTPPGGVNAEATLGAQLPRPGQRRVTRAELPGIERKLALLIGTNRYEDRRVPELTGAVPDVRAVRELLEGRLGYETTVLENAGREEMLRAFNRLALLAQPNDSVIVYYAGHGVVVPIAGIDTGYWLPADADAEFPATWLANADIARLVAAVSARQLMLVSDSCYSGTLVGKERVELGRGTLNAEELLRRRAAVAMSSGGDEPVADSGRGGHSIFAWHFMRALEDLDRWQVGGSLYERVKAAVLRDFPQTPQYGASRSAGHQGDTDYLFERRALEGRAP